MHSSLFRFVMFLLWYLLITGFSAQTGQESGQLSLQISTWLASVVSEVCTSLAPDQLAAVLHPFVRKAAHATEYLVLALLAVYWLTSVKACRRPLRLAAMLCVLLACADECHQLFVPGRAGQMTDVLIDASGVCLGILCAACLRRQAASAAPR